MRFTDSKDILKNFYERACLSSKFEADSSYLESAFVEINKLWLDNLEQIETVNYLMIAEAPLWGRVRKYVYNPDTNNSQFFYRSDLGDILNRYISDKREFLKVCNEIGFLIVDISPFALNPRDTAINYREISTSDYQQLVSLTLPIYFEQKIKLTSAKKSPALKTFFRYARVKNNFENIIANVLTDNKIIKSIHEIGDISQNGGRIDKVKLGRIINSNIKQRV